VTYLPRFNHQLHCSLHFTIGAFQNVWNSRTAQIRSLPYATCPSSSRVRVHHHQKESLTRGM